MAEIHAIMVPMKRCSLPRWGGLLLAALLLPSCSINRWAVNKAADVLSSGSGGGAFVRDDDPELVGDALPFALKMYESLLESAPEHPRLLLTTGSAFIMYANAFLQTPAGMLPDSEYDRRQGMLERARSLYLRGRDYVLKGIQVRHRDFGRYLAMDPMKSPAAVLAASAPLKAMKKEDVPWLFWAGAGWMAAFSTNPFDMRLALSRDQAVGLLLRALELDESFQQGALHEFFVSYYGSLPASAGGSEEKARYHFTRAVMLSGGRSTGPYLALATSIDVATQNEKEYRELLDKALAIDPEQTPENRLVNVLNQRKARWLLEHIDDYFLGDAAAEEPEPQQPID